LSDRGKTKKDLLNELEAARRRVRELEAAGAGGAVVEESLLRSAEYYRRLYQTTQALADETDLDAVIRKIADAALALLHGTDCAVYQLDHGKKILKPIYSNTRKDIPAVMAFEIPLGVGLSGRVAASGRGAFVNMGSDNDYAVHIPGTDEAEDPNESVMAVPMFDGDAVLGVLTSTRVGEVFDDEDLRNLMIFARQAEIAIKRARDVSAVRESEERYRTLVETMTEGLMVVDGDENILFVNQAKCDAFGYTREELIGRNLREIIPVNEIPKLERATAVKKEESRPTRYEISMKRKDGELRDVLVSSRPILDAAGNYVMTLGVDVDITEQKRKDAELLEKTRQLRDTNLRMEELLKNILPAQVIKELESSSASRPRYEENVTIVFIDFVNFSEVAARVNHKALIMKLSAYFHAFDLIIKDYGLEKLKTVGDGYIYAGGLFTASNELEKCAAAALDIVKFVGDRDWRVRIGMHVGPCVAGLIAGWRMIFDVWGETVNLASRLQEVSPPGKICVSDAVYRELADSFEFEPEMTLDLRYFGPTAARCLVGRKPRR
jgi:PAS domain S-box-containing protein